MRKIRHEEHSNHEAWAIPYADLMTLLLAFFVVMYSLSVINESKYRVLAESINEAFNGTGKVIEPVNPSAPAAQVPMPERERAANATPIARIQVPIPPQRLPVPGHEGAAEDASGADPQSSRDTASAAGKAAMAVGKSASLAQIADEVRKAMQPLIDRDLVSVRRTEFWLEIEIRTDILFPSGVARLSTPAEEILDNLATVLAPFHNPLRVEGYTDTQPINTLAFPSNWELSAARAASVVRLFAEQGVEPGRLGILGWGEHHPVADNSTPEGRNRNRRVLVVVLSDASQPSRFYSDAERLAQAPPTQAEPASAGPQAAHAKPSGAGMERTTSASPSMPAVTVAGP